MKINVKLSFGDSSMNFETDSEKLEKRLAMAQKILDSEVLRRCDPYVPRYSGRLIDSGVKGTIIGSGKVEYIAPYAIYQYYGNKGKGRQGLTKRSKKNYKCLRGAYWFERMKADQKDDIFRKIGDFIAKSG